MVNTECIVYEHGKGIPDRIHQKAKQTLAAYLTGDCRPKRHGSGRGESLNVGKRYRLFRRTGSEMFTLFSHEAYNKEYRKY